jgi:hypothetical protein
MTNQKQAPPPPSLQAILGYAGGLLRRQCGHTVVDLAAAKAWFAACVAPWMTWANYNLFIYLGGSESIIQGVYWVEC